MKLFQKIETLLVSWHFVSLIVQSSSKFPDDSVHNFEENIPLSLKIRKNSAIPQVSTLIRNSPRESSTCIRRCFEQPLVKPARTTMQREIAKDLAEIRDSECTPCVVGEHHCCVDARERHGDVRGVKIGNAVGLRGGTCFLLFRVNYKNDRGMPMAILFHLSITRDYPPPRTSCFSFFLFFCLE